MKKEILLSLTALAILVSFGRSDGQLGSKIAYSLTDVNNYNMDIYTINPDSTGRVRLTDHPATDWVPAWSPDGSKIAFRTDRDGDREIYLMNADGSDKVNLTNDPAFDGLNPGAWSPDGSKIAFHSDRKGGRLDVWVMNADGTNPIRLNKERRPLFGPQTEQKSSTSGTQIILALLGFL